MPTIINYDLSTSDKGTGNTRYTLIQDWLDEMLIAYPDLVASDVVPRLNIYNDFGAGLSENRIDFNNFTTDSTRKFILEVVDGERHDGTPGTGFHLTHNTIEFIFIFRDRHVDIIGFELSCPSATKEVFYAPDNALIKDFLIHDYGTKNVINHGGNTCRMENGIIYNIAPAASGDTSIPVRHSILNNVIICAEDSTGAVAGGYNGDIVVHESECNDVYIYHDHEMVTYETFRGCTGDYNAALAINGTIPGGNSINITDASDLNDPINDDYRLKSGSSLRTSGTGGGVLGADFIVSAEGEFNVYWIPTNRIQTMKKNVAGQNAGFKAVNISDGLAFTSAISVFVQKDNGSRIAGAGVVTHKGGGNHNYVPTQAETNGDYIKFSAEAAGAVIDSEIVYPTYPQTTDNDTKISAIPTVDHTSAIAAIPTTDYSSSITSILADTNELQLNQDNWNTATGFNTVAPDNASITAILADTNELQTNQGNWLTATGFNTVAPDNTSIALILADTNELQGNQSNWLTATGFSTHTAADIWAAATRSLTVGVDIIKIRGHALTGDGSAAPFDV